MQRIRRTRAKSTRYPEFPYENYGLSKKGLPWFITTTLDDVYMSPEKKEFFLNEFVFKYISDKKFREENEGNDLVFEGTTYIGISTPGNFMRIGNQEKKKTLVEIGSPKIGAIFGGISTVEYSDKLIKTKDDNDNDYYYYAPNHYKVLSKVSHLDTGERGTYTQNEQIFDTGAQMTVLPCPEYWNYEKQEFDYPENDEISFNSNDMRISQTSNDLFNEYGFIEEWQLNVKFTRKLDCIGITNRSIILYIHFNRPLFIGINNLKPKPIWVMAVSIDEKFPLMKLLGLDIIEQYDYSSVYIKGKKTLLISEPGELSPDEEK